MSEIDKIISNCPLCEQHSLHLAGNSDTQIMQCIWCGYVSSPKFIGLKKDNEEYQKLTEDMKKWSKEFNGRIWIPSMFTLPDGMIYPEDVDGIMKWKLAKMKPIPEEEQKDYPIDGRENEFYTKKYDTDNTFIYDNFYEVISKVYEAAKEKNNPVEIKLPMVNG